MADEFNIQGLTVQQAKEYILQYATAVRLDTKKAEEIAEQLLLWNKRTQLAKTSGDQDLAAAAQQKATELENALTALRDEITHLSAGIERMKRDVTGLAAAERTVDPDLLEQELRILSGDDMTKEPDVNAKKTEQQLKEAEADAALAALKERMK